MITQLGWSGSCLVTTRTAGSLRVRTSAWEQRHDHRQEEARVERQVRTTLPPMASSPRWRPRQRSDLTSTRTTAWAAIAQPHMRGSGALPSEVASVIANMNGRMTISRTAVVRARNSLRSMVKQAECDAGTPRGRLDHNQRDELAHYGRRTAGCARTSKSSARRLGLTGTVAQVTSSLSSVRRREWYAWSSLRARRRTDSVPSTWTRPVRVVLLLSSRRPPRILQDRPRP